MDSNSIQSWIKMKLYWIFFLLMFLCAFKTKTFVSRWRTYCLVISRWFGFERMNSSKRISKLDLFRMKLYSKNVNNMVNIVANSLVCVPKSVFARTFHLCKGKTVRTSFRSGNLATRVNFIHLIIKMSCDWWSNSEDNAEKRRELRQFFIWLSTSMHSPLMLSSAFYSMSICFNWFFPLFIYFWHAHMNIAQDERGYS